jgi:hypothetical protein
MKNESFSQKAGKTAKKVLFYTTFIAVVIAAGVFSFYYFGVYEKGVMSGRVIRISEKGVVFKTYEGKIQLETFGALKGKGALNETFDFSVERKHKDVIDQLQQVSLSGERVNLHFIKRYVRFFWRGDTLYFVVKVEREKK